MIETSAGNGCILKLPANLDLAIAQDLLAALRAKTAEAKPVWLDASDVEALALPCIQVVLAGINLRGVVSVVKPSTAFLSAFTDLGMTWDHQPAELPAGDTPVIAEQPPAEISELGQATEVAVNKRILTIDDSKTMRDMLMLTLSNQGFDVFQAVDGQDRRTCVQAG